MWIFLNIFIILISAMVIPLPKLNDIFWIPRETVFVLGSISLIGIGLICQQYKNLVLKNMWLGLILIYSALSFIITFYLPFVFNNPNGSIVWNLWAIRPTINLILSIFLIQTLVEYTDNLNRWVKLGEVLCWVLFSFSVYAIFQFFHIDPIFNKNTQWILGGDNHIILTFGNTNLAGNFLAILSPLCLMFKKFRFKLFYILAFEAIVLTQSSLSLVAFIIGFLIYLLMTNKTKWFFLLILVLVSGSLTLSHYFPAFFSFSGRLTLWKEIFKVSKESLFFGSGLGSLAFRNMTLSTTKILSAHCEPLQILSEGGLVLSTLVFGYLITLFKNIFFTKKTMLLIGYVSAFSSFLIISLGSFPFRIAPLALIGIIYIASLEAQIIKGE